MKTASIQLKKSYEVSVSRGTTIVTVLGINPKTGAWRCKTQSGKDIAISDAKRFLKAIDDGKGAKKKKSYQGDAPVITPKKSRDKGDNGTSLPESEGEPQAVTSPTGKPEKAKESKPVAELVSEPVAETKTLEQLRKVVKEADKKLRTAKNALLFQFIDPTTLDAATAEYDEACQALKAAGSNIGTGGRCLGQMSGRDAAYKVLCETRESMNGRQICEMALDLGYWEPQGETPEATIVSAMLTEMKRKGDAARFIRTGKGLFAAKQ